MARYVIVGAGPSGLYVAYRLLTSGQLSERDTVALYEWNESVVGGRIRTYSFPSSVGADGQYIEAGGMRLATDPQFPRSIASGHVLVQHMIQEMGLAGQVVPFEESSDRLYYLRNQSIYQSDIPDVDLPYHFDPAFIQAGYGAMTADAIVGDLAQRFAPGSSGWSRQQWCDYFASGKVGPEVATPVFPEGTPIRDIGYWNLLYDQLGNEGFDYVENANGYESNVINWNTADANQANADFGSTVRYSRIQGGYSLLFDAMRERIQRRINIHMGARLRSFDFDGGVFTCHFDGLDPVTADSLFLAMPRRSLEMVAAGCPPDNVLRQEQVRLYMEAAIDQPALRVGMLFEDAWWADDRLCRTPPRLQPNGAGGPTITDLPLRQVYYFGNNSSPRSEGGPYVILASYDDMQYSEFWRVLETTGDLTEPPSRNFQPMTGPTPVPPDGPMAQMLLEQLARVHGADVGSVPTPLQTVYMDWGRNPFGGGYHAWAANYDLCAAMTKMRAPGIEIQGDDSNKLFIVGSCYSIDQAWVEGAFCVAESVLQDYLDLESFCPLPDHYALICRSP